jgi:hypothetical protein
MKLKQYFLGGNMKNKIYTIHMTIDEVNALRKARDITVNKFIVMKKEHDKQHKLGLESAWDTLPHNDTQRDLYALVDKVNEEVNCQYQNELKAREGK